MANLAIIPARGGSKRIQKKNIKDFNGLPILAYPIRQAILTGLFSEMMVSTDDNEIAETALRYKATVPFMRSAENANDFATLADVIIEVILKYKEQGREFDAVCCILPTAALITQERITEAYEKFSSQKLSSVVPVIRFYYPIQRALKSNNGLLEMREPQYMQTRSQDLDAHYHDSGQFYWIRTEDLLKEKTIFTKNTGFIELDETEAHDVDTPQDWEMLSVKYDYIKSTSNKIKE